MTPLRRWPRAKNGQAIQLVPAAGRVLSGVVQGFNRWAGLEFVIILDDQGVRHEVAYNRYAWMPKSLTVN